MNDKTFTLSELTEQELNTLLNGVAQLPYIQSYQLIQKIQQQVSEQTQKSSTD